jgi:hypothetical protein
MKQVFRAHRLCKQDGPLGPYINAYAAEMLRARNEIKCAESQCYLGCSV